MGLWISFALVAAVFALMGWSVYQSPRSNPTETLPGYKHPRSLDAIDVWVFFVAWIAVVVMAGLGPELGNLSDSQRGLLEFITAASVYKAFPVAVGAVWLRRRFSPRTVVRFHLKNLALRIASVFCSLASPIALLFGVYARWMEKSGLLAWSFFLTAGGLVALAGWFYRIEFRRRPQQPSGDGAEESAGPGGHEWTA